MKIIGITGFIGCGKSTIAKIVRNLGFCVFDADFWGRKAYSNTSVISCVKRYFPEVFENGKINKKTLREIVFKDHDKLKTLENIIHPYVFNKLKSTIRKNTKKCQLLFIDLALLYEMGWDKYCYKTIGVFLEKDKQKERVLRRDKISETQFNNIYTIQQKNKDKIEKVDILINTDKSIQKLKQEIILIIDGIL